jgi:hypothetical protein
MHHLTATALAHEHRSRLLAEADQHRLARGPHTAGGSRRGPIRRLRDQLGTGS